MKLVSFFRDNRRRFGAIVDDKIFDLTDIEVDGQLQNGLRDVLGNESALNELERLLSKGNQPDFGLDDVSYMLPIPDPHKIFCVGRNYLAY
ncbi:MAG: 5-carboxymethyl-2-hydroxymuconate isomerase, partial [Rhodospirillales bacterium]